MPVAIGNGGRREFRAICESIFTGKQSIKREVANSLTLTHAIQVSGCGLGGRG